MTYTSKMMAGIILLTVPTIEFGGYFLLQVLSGMQSELALTPFQESMFRAGHAHAGVLVILSLIALLFVDQTKQSEAVKWMIRAGFPTAALLVSGGFFAGAAGENIQTPTNGIILLFIGVFILALSLLLLGIGLIKSKPK